MHMTHTQQYPEGVKGEHLDTQPGKQHEMKQQPQSHKSEHVGSGKLRGKVAIITGGDSGIGRAAAIAFAVEGADVAIGYLEEDKDAQETKRLVEEHGVRCITLGGDVGDPEICKALVQKTVDTFGRLDILVNNAAEQHMRDTILEITPADLERTFRTNIFAMFYMVQAALPHLKPGSSIINTASVVAYQGNPALLDYTASKGAIVAFTRGLSNMIIKDGIRVNAVAPGPIWTPLIPATFPKEKVEKFGKDTPMGRPGQPEELGLAYVYLASDDSSYMSGQTLHLNGGTIVNG